jgi:hypothetical protein
MRRENPTCKGKGQGIAGFEDKIKPFPNPHSWLHKQMRSEPSKLGKSPDYMKGNGDLLKAFKTRSGGESSPAPVMNYGGGYTAPAALPRRRVGVGGQASAV